MFQIKMTNPLKVILGYILATWNYFLSTMNVSETIQILLGVASFFLTIVTTVKFLLDIYKNHFQKEKEK